MRKESPEQVYTVARLAALAGISVRTLHHYHQIGLLAPSFTGENGYRYYAEAELLRLQRILIYRELGFPLGQIASLLDAEGGDLQAALERQRAQLLGQLDRYLALVLATDRTLARLRGEDVKDEELYSGVVSPAKQAEYEAWLAERYGPEVGEQVAAGSQRIAAMGDAERTWALAEIRSVEEGLAGALRRGISADSPELDSLIQRHRAWVQKGWAQECSPKAYAALADLYTQHPDFVARFEALQPGLASYLAQAMRSWAGRQG